MPQVEHAEQGPQVVAGDAARLRRRAQRVVEPQPGVPDRVPDAGRDLGALAGVAVPGTQQEQVEVAARRELAAAVPADRDERGAERGAAGGVGTARQPARR